MDNKKKVFLHIGHGKTGSTALQCFLAQNYSNLIKNNILYNKSELMEFNLALENKINSGNINPKNDWVKDGLLRVLESQPNYKSYIFSNENLFHNMKPFIDLMRNIKNRNQFEFVIILCLRNPIEMLLSEYNQNVKREGCYQNLQQFLYRKNFTCTHTKKSCGLIKKLENLNIKYLLFNYSVEKYEIVSSISKKINIFEFCDLNNITEKEINRSLSENELLLVRFINKFYGKNVGAKVADKIVNEIPKSLIKTKSKFDNINKNKIIENNIKNIRFLNRRIEKNRKLNMNISNFYKGQELDFSNYEKIIINELNKFPLLT